MSVIMINGWLGDYYDNYIKFNKVTDHKFSKELLVWI